jgi:hypothetical protein
MASNASQHNCKEECAMVVASIFVMRATSDNDNPRNTVMFVAAEKGRPAQCHT